MKGSTNYVAYFDMLGVGDASGEYGDRYHDQLRRFRQAVCDAVDQKLANGDRVFAFSDSAFVSSKSISRLADFVSMAQTRLWEHGLFLKGGISAAQLDFNDFAALPDQSDDLIEVRSQKLSGYWFSKEFVRPALLEKNLKGIAIHIDEEAFNSSWLETSCAYSAHYPGESLKKPSVFRDLLIPERSLRYLDSILKTYLIVSHTSRRVSRYYISLIITWINSHNFTTTVFDITFQGYATPLRQLIGAKKLATEIIQLPGGDLIYYALLSKVDKDCKDQKVIEQVVDFLGASKRLRIAAEFIPPQICATPLCRRVTETHVRQLFA